MYMPFFGLIDRTMLISAPLLSNCCRGIGGGIAGGGARGQLDKKQLAEAIQEERNCSPSTAYRLIDAAVMHRIIKFNKMTKIYAKK